MLERYKDFGTILMPLHPANRSYLRFGNPALPEARKQVPGVEGMKCLANAKLLRSARARERIQPPGRQRVN